MTENPNQSEINAAYKAAIQEERADGEKWNQKKSLRVARATISKLKKPDGTYFQPSDDQADRVAVVFTQTTELKRRILRQAIEDAETELDDTTAAMLDELMNPAAVQQKLDNLANPERKTLRDFIA